MWFVFVGSKGGVGATTLTWEVAQAATRAVVGPRVAVVDADFAGRRGMAVLAEATRDLDLARLEGPIATATSGGVTVVEMTESLDAALTVTPEMSEVAAQRLDADGSMVFADIPQPCALVARPFVTRATRFLLITPPTLLGMTGARAMINAMGRFHIPKERIVAVVQWQAGRLDVTLAEVARNLGVPVIADIPPIQDRSYRKSVDELLRTLCTIRSEPPLLAAAAAASDGVPHLHDRRSSDSSLPRNRRSTDRRADPGAAAAPQGGDAVAENRASIKTDIHAELGKRIDALQTSNSSQSEMTKVIEDLVRDIVCERRDVTPEDSLALREEILDEVLGLGPLEALLHDDTISEIMVNGPDTVYVERRGRLTLSKVRFSSEAQLRQTIDRIITPLGRRIDESSPLVDARLPDGSRINAVISPLALDGGVLTIRRFGKKRIGIPELLSFGALNEQMVAFLQACVQSRMNILVSGGTGSGKTTLLNIMSNFIPDGDRIVTIEDAAELLLGKPHVVRLEARPPNIEGHGEVKIRDLVRNALRMRPDRIVVGECRGAEALDMLQAMNTGHDGSLTTLHANSPRDSISRLEILVMMAGFDLPVRAIREQVASAIDLVIQTARLRDGSRKVMAITEVIGMEGDVVTLQDIVQYHLEGLEESGKVIGEFRYTGVQPQAVRRFDEHGVEYDMRELSSMATGAAAW